MTTVPTARGVVTGSDLGRTFMPERVLLRPGTSDVRQGRADGSGSEDDRVADAVRRLTALADQGVRTIVDPTVDAPGRYVPWIQRIADQVPQVNIVVATGGSTDAGPDAGPDAGSRGRGSSIDLRVGRELPDPMVDRFVRDLTDGFAGTGVRAGMLTCAVDRDGLTPGAERAMRAVARAHHATDAPITVHTHPGSRTGLAVRRVLCDEEGVEPRRIVLANSGDTTDVDHLAELADAGFVLGMDRFGISLRTTFGARADTLVEMCRRGYAASMVLSQEVLPHVRAAGVRADEITQMLVDVPRRVLAG